MHVYTLPCMNARHIIPVNKHTTCAQYICNAFYIPESQITKICQVYLRKPHPAENNNRQNVFLLHPQLHVSIKLITRRHHFL